ncbi:MAG TPA: T9SS type A sorting domain-containing protein [Catalimonadaceae bacterium]|nr:T9SS type A sorting domain-containing protein [Catalimonadaceae bacterium]
MKYIFPLLSVFLIPFADAQNFSPDPIFGTNGLVEQNVAAGTSRMNAISVASNGAILTAGNTNNFSSDFVVNRISESGTPDNSFGTAGTVSIDFTNGLDNLKSMALQSDGKILVAGSSRLNNVTSCVASRLLANGTIDNSFGDNGYLKFMATGTTSFSTIEKTVLLPDGSILVGGYFLQNGVYRGFVRKYLANGTPDANFGTSGQTTINFSTATASSYVFDLLPEANGKIAVLGQNYTTRFLIGMARLSSTGALDTGFSTDGVLNFSFATGQNYATRLFKRNDGKYVAAGYANTATTNYKVCTARLETNGDQDLTYDADGFTSHGANTSYTSCLDAVMLADESVLLTGEAYFTNIYHPVVYKITTAGTLDATFGTGGFGRINTGTNSGFGRAILFSVDKILLAGAVYTSSSNANIGLVAATQINGAPSTSFGQNGQVLLTKSTANNRVKHLDKTLDGKYFVSGDVENYDPDQVLVKFNTDGSPDNSFGSQGVSVSDFGSIETYYDRVVLNDGEMVQLSARDEVTLAFAGLGNFSGPSDYGLVKTSTSGIQNATAKKFRFAATEFTFPKVIRKDPSGNIYVLANQSQPVRSACYISKHLGSSLALDNSFGTQGKFQLHGFSSSSDVNCVDVHIDNTGNIYILRNTGNTIVAPFTFGFRIRKYNAQMVSDGSFGDATLGELAVEDALASSFSANRMYAVSNGLLVSGIKAGVATIARITLAGEVAGYIQLPALKSISKIVIGTDGALYVSGMGQNNRFRLEKFQADGSPVTTFNGSGFIADNFFSNAVSIQDFLVESPGTITILTRTRAGLEGEKLGLVRLIETTSSAPLAIQDSPFVKVYPNPASEQLFWENTQPSGLDIITIWDSKGRKAISAQASDGNAGIRIETLAPGTYWLEVEGGKYRNKVPFIKK